MDPRRIKRLASAMREAGITKLTINDPDGGATIELGSAPAPAAPTPAGQRQARVDPRDAKTVDEFLRDRFKGTAS